MASINTSGVAGISRTQIPVAFSIAFTIAAAGPSIGNSPMPLAPCGPKGYGCSSKNTRMGGISAAVDVFVERHADGLRNPALDLSRREHGMNHFPYFLQRDEVRDARLEGNR